MAFLVGGDVLHAHGGGAATGTPGEVLGIEGEVGLHDLVGGDHKDKFNSSQPSGDGQFLPYVLDPEPARLISQIFGIAVPPPRRNDLVAVFLTGITGINMPDGVTPGEELRLSMAIAPTATPNRLGVVGGDLCGYALTPAYDHAPNNQLGDGANFNDRLFLPYFPYLATPHQGFRHRHHRLSPTTSSTVATGSNMAQEVEFDEEIDGDDDRASTLPTSKGVGPTLMGPKRRVFSKLTYTLDKPAHLSLTVLDLQGRLVRSLIDQDAAAGTFSASWDGRDQFGARAQRGVYFARYSVNGKVTDSRKVILQ